MEDYLTCSVCLENFNESNHVPLLLSCGHSLCKACIEEISKVSLICPLDRIPEFRAIESLSKNISLMQIMSHKFSKKSYPCYTHNTKSIKYYCFLCRTGFCNSCIPFHSNCDWVNLEMNENIKSKLKEPVDQIIHEMKKASEYTQMYKYHIEKSQKYAENLIKEIKNKCRGLKALIDKKESELIEEFNINYRDFEAKLEEKLINAFNVMKNKETIFYEIQNVASGLEDHDLANKINSLERITLAIKSSKNFHLMPLDEMIYDIKIDLDNDSLVKKNISKIRLDMIQFGDASGGLRTTKKKKVCEGL